MTERKALGKKKRFQVFKRDSFTCQYCGSTPPRAVLEIDHIEPVSKGGDNDIDNLITACFDCNRGKSDERLTAIPQTVSEKAEMVKEKEEQLREFNKLLAAKKRRETRLINEIQAVFEEEFDERTFQDRFRESIRHNFIPYLTKDQLMMAIYKACAKCNRPDAACKYFCGICWNIIKRGDT